MMIRSGKLAFMAMVLVVLSNAHAARGENLQQAWGVALSVNQQLQAQQQTSVAAAFDVKAAQSARYVSGRSYNVDAFLTPGKGSGTSTKAGSGNAAGAMAGSGELDRQSDIHPDLIDTGVDPDLYRGQAVEGPSTRQRPSSGAQKATEFRTVIELKLTVAEAYVAVLRAQRNLETARSNVEQLASFARDVRNRLDQGLAIRSDDLAAQVSLSNAELNELTSRTSLESAWATYNALPMPASRYDGGPG